METNEPIYIRNMVCDRCRMVVRELFAELGIETRSVELGVVRTAAPVAEELRKRLGERLRELGFELLDEPRQRIVEQVKTEIIRLVHRDNGALRVNLSDRNTARAANFFPRRPERPSKNTSSPRRSSG